MSEAGLYEVETYVSCFQNIVVQFISNRPIMDMCMLEEWRPVPQVSRMWWKQEGVDVEGMRTAVWGAKRTEGGEETDGTATETGD